MALQSQTELPHKHRSLSLLVIATGVAAALLYFGRIFFITMVIAVIITFLLEPFVNLLMKVRMPRSLASFVVCVVALLLVYLAGLGAYSQVSILVADLPNYSARISNLADSVSTLLERIERRVYELIIPAQVRRAAQPPPPAKPPPAPSPRAAQEPDPVMPVEPEIPEVRIRREPTPLVEHVYNYVVSLGDVLLMASFVPFLVYFMLSWQDHFHRTYLQLFEGQDRYAAGRSWEGIAEMARAYVLGNFVLGLLLSVISTIFFWVMELPFPLLTGPLSGFLSLIPYIGLPLSMAPPFFVALSVYDRLPPYIVIGAVVGFLHLLALNFLYPKRVGSRVHLNPLVVTVALMIFAILWGGVGLVLAIPIAAGLKAVCDNVPDLQPYGKLLGD